MPKKFPVGSNVWHCVSRKRQAWRVGIVTKSKPVAGYSHSYEHITILQPTNKTKRDMYGWEVDSLVIPRAVIPEVPNGTIYIVDTMIGEMLSKRMGDGSKFSVFECGTKAMTDGNLLGYIVFPGNLYQVVDWHKDPKYKIWQVAPNVYEVLSFLGNKLPEITALYKELASNAKQKSKSIINSI